MVKCFSTTTRAYAGNKLRCKCKDGQGEVGCEDGEGSAQSADQEGEEGEEGGDPPGSFISAVRRI